MATSKDQIGTSYPLPVYNYKVNLGTDTLSFSEVSGLNLSQEMITYKHGLSFAMGYHIIPGQKKMLRIKLSRGVLNSRQELFQWIKSNEEKDLSIDLCDSTGNPLIRWKVLKALPAELDAPNFNARSNEIAIEGLTVVAQDLDMEYL